MPHQIARTGRLLVVSAHPPAESSAIALLGQHGHELIHADSGAQALALAGRQAPDLILLDLPLPDITGVELLAALHAQPRLRQIPAIVLAANSDRARLLRAFEAGAVDCVGKPCEPEEVLARVHVHLHLKLTRDRLEQVARERQELVNLVAHDLKNPLTSVLFACEMLALPEGNPTRAPRYLQIIDESTREALGYIRSYLESQSRPGQPGHDGDGAGAACAHLDETLHWLAARYELQLEAHGLRLQIDPSGSDACVAISGQVLRQVGENLVSNALKYARDGGELTLAARAGAPGFWQLVAQDRGPGIPESFQSRLFKPFQRMDAGDAAAPVSNGLGLALARQIVGHAGGRLWYEDREGGGARFLVELPAAACTQACGSPRAQTP